MANGSHENLTDGQREGLSDTGSPVGDSTRDLKSSPESATGDGAASIDESLVDVGAERHIFISYQSEDRERVRPLAEALERRGWPVWWDRDIRAGESFRKVIAKALDDAACVVVLWSELSVDSEWVQEEAQWARRRKILVPAILDDDVHQPLGFGQVQTANVAGWSGEADDPILDDLLEGVATHLGFDYIPPLLNSEEWEAIQDADRASMGRAEARQIERFEAADSAAHLAVTERQAAAAAEAEVAVMAANDAVDDATTRVAAVHATEQRELAEEAERSAADAEAQAAEAAADLAGERAVALRAAAAKAAEREARALAAEEAAARAQAERLAQASAGERETAANAIEREAAVREAEERAQAALEAAERAAARRAEAARAERAARAPLPVQPAQPSSPPRRARFKGTAPPREDRHAPPPSKRRRWPLLLALLIFVVAGGVVVAILSQGDTDPPDSDPLDSISNQPDPTSNQPDPTSNQPDPTSNQPDPTTPPNEPDPVREPSIDIQEVQFESGSSGTTLSGNVTSDRHIEYSLRASAGQRMIVHALSTSGLALFTVETADENFIARDQDVFLGDLPISDVYRISVYPEGDAADYDIHIDITSDCSTFNVPESLPLGLCDRGRLVEDVQRALVERGFALVADGEFGRNTQEVIAAFQYGSGLPATGRVDEATLNGLS